MNPQMTSLRLPVTRRWQITALIALVVVCGVLWLSLWRAPDAGSQAMLDRTTAAQPALARPQAESSHRSQLGITPVPPLTAGDPQIAHWDSELTGDDPRARVLSNGTLLNGKKEGVWRVFGPDGTLWIEHRFRNGQLEGVSTTWDSSGRQQEDAEYHGDRLDGTTRGWFTDGVEAYSYSFRDGVRDGVWTEWYENGHLRAEGTSRRGAYDGRCVFYEQDGSVDVKTSGFYKAGHRVGSL